LNPTFHDPEILINWHLKRAVPTPKVWLFTRKRASSTEQADLRNMFKKASNTICRLTVLVSPNPLSSTPSTSSTMKTQENTKGKHDDPEPPYETGTQMEYLSD